jgi:hypothetical protein
MLVKRKEMENGKNPGEATETLEETILMDAVSDALRKGTGLTYFIWRLHCWERERARQVAWLSPQETTRCGSGIPPQAGDLWPPIRRFECVSLATLPLQEFGDVLQVRQGPQ